MNELLLTLAAGLTSLLTALVGLGGGVVLMGLMPGLLPLAAIIPVHALVQFVSNSARVGFALSEVSPAIIAPIAAGSVLGALIGSQFVGLISLEWLPAVAGLLILAMTWLPFGRLIPQGRWSMFLLGLYQTGIGMLAGATGPLGAAVMVRINQQREWLVVNTGVYMTLNHGIRAAAFGLMGFAYAQWWPVIVMMGVSSIVGAWAGTQLRQRLPAGNYARVFRWLITLLAVRMVVMTVLEMKS